MRGYFRYAVLIFSVVCGGCGNQNLNASLAYDTPVQQTPSNGQIGGAVQGTVLAAGKTVSVIAGAVGTYGLVDGSGTAARFYQPTDITTDGTNFYVTDYLNNAVRRIDSAGAVTTLQLIDADNGTAVTLNRPSGITTDGKSLYLVDSGSHTIRFIDLASNKVSTIGSTSGIAAAVDSVFPTAVRFNQPTGITTDGTNLYVTDSGSQLIRRIVISTKAVTTVAGSSASIGTTDGIQGDARFNFPARITTDGTSLYVTDFFNRTIRRITISTGAVTTIAGLAGIPGSDDSTGSGDAARFYQPNGITTDGTYLYVTDSYNDTIRRLTISPTGGYSGPVSTIAGSVAVSGSVDGSVTTATFNTPIGITTDGKSLYVADSGNHTIRIISP